jgi:hypothetical protein
MKAAIPVERQPTLPEAERKMSISMKGFISLTCTLFVQLFKLVHVTTLLIQ